MLWIKSFHIVFVVSWYAGLLYLPRLYVYHADTDDQAGHERFVVMERKLFYIMTIAAVIASGLGLWLLAIVPAWMTSGWMHAKLTLWVLLVGYHVWCWRLNGQFARRENRHGHAWYRWFNEVPALILIAIVILVVVKPF